MILRTDNETTLKQYIVDGSNIFLKPLRNRYPIQDVTEVDVQKVGVVARAVDKLATQSETQVREAMLDFKAQNLLAVSVKQYIEVITRQRLHEQNEFWLDRGFGKFQR